MKTNTKERKVLLENPIHCQAVKILAAFHSNQMLYAVSQHFATDPKYT